MIRAALTETNNAYAAMPGTVEQLDQLAGKLDAVRQANLDHHAELAFQAADAGVQVIGFGELFAGPYFALDRNPMWRQLAESAVDGPTVTRMREVAKDNSLVIVAPIYELAPSGKRFNTAVVIEKNGDVLGTYRKTHIPEGKNEQNQFCETFYYDRSDGRMTNGPANISDNRFFPVFETSACRIGVAICYDRHFAGVAETLAKNGAELVLSPAVTFGAQSERLWQREFDVDACRENVFIGGSNRRGSEPPWNQPYFGNSFFVGPNGRATPIPVHPDLVVADLDIASLSRPDPSGWALSRDRRDDICD